MHQYVHYHIGSKCSLVLLSSVHNRLFYPFMKSFTTFRVSISSCACVDNHERGKRVGLGMTVKVVGGGTTSDVPGLPENQEARRCSFEAPARIKTFS